MSELTMHFKHQMIGVWQKFKKLWIKWNFELTINRARPVEEFFIFMNTTCKFDKLLIVKNSNSSD